MENGEKMRFFFFRDNCDMGMVYETIKDMKEKIEVSVFHCTPHSSIIYLSILQIRGGYVHKFWSDAQRDPYSITLICDKYPWHRSCVKQECIDSKRDMFSI